MKPLPRAPLTREDRAIWVAAKWRVPGSIFDKAEMFTAYSRADRRDAELMLLAKLNPYYDVLYEVHNERQLLIRWGSLLGLRYTTDRA